MNKAELIEALAKETELSKAAAGRAVSALVDIITKTVAGDTPTSVVVATIARTPPVDCKIIVTVSCNVRQNAPTPKELQENWTNVAKDPDKLDECRSGATAAVGSARTQPRPACQYSAQACASLWRTTQNPPTPLYSPPW